MREGRTRREVGSSTDAVPPTGAERIADCTSGVPERWSPFSFVSLVACTGGLGHAESDEVTVIYPIIFTPGDPPAAASASGSSSAKPPPAKK